MTTRDTHLPAETNLLGDALVESRRHFRKLLHSLQQLIADDRLEEGRRHLPKLEALAQELHRVLNPRDPVDRKLLAQIDRDLAGVSKALRKGWGGTIGKGVLALVLGGVLGVIALIGIFLMAFM